MRRLLSILGAAVSLIGTAQGRIGDTEAQIRTRYGDAITALPARTRDASLTKCYASKHFLIAVTYVNGRSVREIVTKANSSKMTDAEIHALLAADGAGSSWDAQQLTGPQSVIAGVRQWRTSDPRSRVAFYDSQTRALFITNQQFIDQTKANKRLAPAIADRRDILERLARSRNIDLLGNGSGLPMGRGQPQPSASPAK